jgi:PAS domain S-box-containing protein
VVTKEPAVPSRSDGKDQHDWVEGWRQAVRVGPLALALFELPSSRFIEVSPRAAELLGTTREAAIGLDYLAIVEPRRAAQQVLQLVISGALDSAQARRRLRRVDGSMVEVSVSGRAIRSSVGADLVLWLAADVRAGEPHPAVSAELLVDLRDDVPFSPDVVHPVVGMLDHRWRVAQMGTNVEELLGHRPADLLGSSLIDLTHPADAASLLLAFARATSDGNGGVRVRMSHRDRTWQTVTALVTLRDRDASSRFGFVLAPDDDPSAAAALARVAELEQHLQRIAVEVQAAGVLPGLGPTADASQVPALSDLSARQLEVVSRLARGERVSRIAHELYLSQSTVRNHLSAIFHKVGVHSQRELLDLLRRD